MKVSAETTGVVHSLKAHRRPDDVLEMMQGLRCLSDFITHAIRIRLFWLAASAAAGAGAGWATAERVNLPTLAHDDITHVHVLVSEEQDGRNWFRVYAPWIHEQFKAMTWDYAHRGARRDPTVASCLKATPIASFYLRWKSGREYECQLLSNRALLMGHVEIPLTGGDIEFLMGLVAQARCGIDYRPPPMP